VLVRVHLVVAALLAAGMGAAPAGAQAPVCGNRIIEPPETCDDGNTVSGDGCSAVCQLENRPPVCDGATPSVALLWPPNHKFVEVGIDGVTDPDGDPVAVVVTAISQDEPLDDPGSGNTCPDAAGVGTGRARLRAERSGGGDGRVYHVSFRADDGRGGECTGTVEVCVRHDQRPGGTCGDQGPRFTSTAGACDGDTCKAEDCAPSDEELAAGACKDVRLPSGAERHLKRARELLTRSARAEGRRARRLRLAAARHLHKTARAARRAGVAAGCTAAVEEAEACARCAEEDE
jgi:cysteine-rich repeat protein